MEARGEPTTKSRPTGPVLHREGPPGVQDLRYDEHATELEDPPAPAIVPDPMDVLEVVGQADHLDDVERPLALLTQDEEIRRRHSVHLDVLTKPAEDCRLLGTTEGLTVLVHEVELERGELPLRLSQLSSDKVGDVEHGSRAATGDRRESKLALPGSVLCHDVVVHRLGGSEEAVGHIYGLGLVVLVEVHLLIRREPVDLPEDRLSVVERDECSGPRHTVADLLRHRVRRVPARRACIEQCLDGVDVLRPTAEHAPPEGEEHAERRDVLHQPPTQAIDLAVGRAASAER